MYFLISGGVNVGYLSSTEIYESGEFRAGPDMPQALFNHCTVRINETHSIITGGQDGVGQKVIFAYTA